MAAEPYHDSKRPAPHWEMLAICLAVVVVSLLFEVRSDDRVAFFAWPSHPAARDLWLSRTLWHPLSRMWSDAQFCASGTRAMGSILAGPPFGMAAGRCAPFPVSVSVRGPAPARTGIPRGARFPLVWASGHRASDRELDFRSSSTFRDCSVSANFGPARLSPAGGSPDRPDGTLGGFLLQALTARQKGEIVVDSQAHLHILAVDRLG